MKETRITSVNTEQIPTSVNPEINSLRSKIAYCRKKRDFLNEKILYLENKVSTLSSEPIETPDKPSHVIPVAFQKKDHIGTLIRTYRLKNELKVKELAELSGISQVTISSLESGTNRGRQDTLFKLADTLDIPRDEIIAQFSADHK